jgi:CheY-like chemotaxis protein
MNSERTSARILLLGFGEFERHALASYLRLSSSRDPAYEQVQSVSDADFVIADADHPGVIDIVLADDRAADTVFIGSLAPEGALGWAMRPIDPMQVFREIDAAVALRQRGNDGAPITTSPGTLDAPSRRAGDVAAAPTALLVDDSEIALRYLQRQLESLGLRCEAAGDSTRAVQLLSQRHFDIVFLDVDLGPDSETDGLTLCQRLKRAHRPPGSGLPPKVIIVSAHDSPTDRVRGTFAGCDAYLGKPIDDAALQSHLRRLGLTAPPAPKRKSRRRPEGAPTSGPTPLV